MKILRAVVGKHFSNFPLLLFLSQNVQRVCSDDVDAINKFRHFYFDCDHNSMLLEQEGCNYSLIEY